MAGNERLGFEFHIDEKSNAVAVIDKLLASIKQISDGFAGIGTAANPFIKAISDLAKGTSDLTSKFDNVKFDKLTGGLDQVTQKTTAMAAGMKNSTEAMSNSIDSTTKKLAGFLKLQEGGAEFERLGKRVKSAFDLEGIEKGFDKLTKLKNLVIEADGAVAKMAKGSVGLPQVRENIAANPDSYRIFTMEKYKAEIVKAQVEMQKLNDLAVKHGLGAASNIKTLATQVNGDFFTSNGAQKDIPTKTLTQVEGLRASIKEIQKSTENVINFNKIDSQVDALRKKFYDLVPENLKAKLDALTTPGKWEDSVRGTLKYGEALRKVKDEIDAVNTADKNTRTLAARQVAASNINDTKKVSFASYSEKDADGHITLRNKTVLEGQEALGSAILAVTRNTNSAVKSESIKVAKDHRDGLMKLSAEQMELQRNWNAQAGTQGVNYKANPYGSGFVRSSVDTSKVDVQSQINSVMPSAAQVASVTRLADAFQKLGTVSIAQAKAEMDRLGISVRNVSSADMTKMEKGFRDVGLSINRATGEIKTLKEVSSGMFSFLPDTLGKMAARLTEFYSIRAVLFAVTSQFREATSAAIDLNQSVHDILGISGESKDQFGAISDSIYAIAKSSRYTAAEVAQSMQVLAQAGVAAKDLPMVAKQTDWFATATASDPKLAAELVTTSMNVFAIDASNVTRSTNAMTAALNLSKLETAGLATAFNYLAPQAAQLGMSMEQTLAIIANMAQSGIKASTIGTGISQMLKEFSAPKPRLRNMLKEVGLSPDDINPMKHNFADIVQTLKESGVTVDQLFSAMETRVGRAAVTAINLSANSFREMEANLTGTHGALIAYDKTMEGAKARMNVTKQSFQELATVIGSVLAPALIWINGAIQDFIKILSSDDGSITKITLQITLAAAAVTALALATNTMVKIGAINAVLGPIGAGFGLMVAGVSGLVPAVRTAVLGMQAFSAAGILLPTIMSEATVAIRVFGAALMTALPYAIVVAAIAAIGYGIYKLVDALGAERREKEALNKANLEKIDAEERLLRNANAIINSTQESSKAYAAYNKARKEGISHEEALKLVTDKSAVATTEQMAILNKYVKEGGPMAQKIKMMMLEGDQLKAMILLTRELNQAEGMRITNAVNNYNAKRKVVADPASIMKEAAGGGAGNYKEVTAEFKARYDAGDPVAVAKYKKIEKKREEAALKDDPDYAYNARIAATGGSVTVDALAEQRDKNGKIVKDKAGNPVWQKDKQGNDLIVPRIRSAQANPDGTYEMVTQALPVAPRTGPKDADGKTKKDNLMVDPAIQLEIDNQTSDKNTIIANLKLSYHSSIQIEEELKKIAVIDARIAELKGEGAVNKVDTQFKNKKGWSDAAKNTWDTKPELRKQYGSMDNWYAQSISEAEKKDAKFLIQTADEQKKLRAELEKLQVTHELEIVKLKDSAHKAALESEQKNLEKEIADGYTNEVTRAESIDRAKMNAARITSAKYLDEIAALNAKSKDKTYSPEQQADFAQLSKDKDIDRLKAVQEAMKGIDEKGKAGILAGIDIQLKTEQELLRVKQMQQAVIEKDQLGYDNIKNVRIETLGMEEESLGTQIGILKNKTLEKLTDEEKNKIAADLLILEEKRKVVAKDISDLKRNELGFMAEGAKAAWNDLSNTDKLSKELGSNVTNSAFNGITGTLSDTFTTAFNPDKQKLADQQISINKLNQEKGQLEADIRGISLNSTKTPAEIQSLNEKKIKLQEVNNELHKQQEILDKQKNSWQTFADGLKNVMVQILKELQNYIIKMLVVAAVKKMIGMAVGAYDNNTMDMTFTNMDGVGPNGTGQPMADGGMVPLNMGIPGKDSIPAMLMPGEVVIKKSSVDYYGADKLLAMNEKRIQKFADGGMVGGGTFGKTNSEAKQEFSLSIVNVADASQIPAKPANAQEIINIVSYDLARKGTIYKALKGSG